MERINEAVFTEEMRKTHTILVPDMLPIHFNMFVAIFETYGYKMKLLTSDSRTVIDEGLKSVHNDTCYPALLVVGQFLEALHSGEYDVDKTALMITQTGGGCRASNYLHLLKKALGEEFPQVPVISLNFSGLGSSPGFKLTAGLLLKMISAMMYGDLLMSLYNQCKPYEVEIGSTDSALKECEAMLKDKAKLGGFNARKKNYRYILKRFAEIKRAGERKPRVGIVGEIYVKYSPLANNHLEEFLIKKGCEPVVPGLMDFVLYCAVNNVNDRKLYGRKNIVTRLSSPVYKLLGKLNANMQKEIARHGVFEQSHDFEQLRAEADKLINQGVKMGEGWLITAEMGCLVKHGVKNVVCTQPFGCLPNHIVAKGMARKVKEEYPDANIVAIDYDPSATSVNQENRLNLMIANIRGV